MLSDPDDPPLSAQVFHARSDEGDEQHDRDQGRGSHADHFYIQGRRITVKDGICTDAQGVLAGSDLDMATALRNAIDLLGVDLETASTMASGAPAAFLGMSGRRGRIAVGQAADLVALNPDLTIAAAWIAGEIFGTAGTNSVTMG